MPITFQNIMIAVFIISVVILVVSEIRKGRMLIYLFKPLSILLVISIAFMGFRSIGFNGIYGIMVLLALFLSMVGDVALLPPDGPKRFQLGLVAFLSAHIVYIGAFSTFGLPRINDIVVGLIIGIFSFFFYRKIKKNLGSMKISVIAYMFIISLMLTRAVSTLLVLGFDSPQGWFIAAGSLLFFTSDIMLSANRYCKSWKYNRVSLAFYFSGQLFLALSIGA